MSDDKSDKPNGCERGDAVQPVADLGDGSFVGVRHKPDHTTEVKRYKRLEDGETIPPGETEIYAGEGMGVYERVDLSGKGPVKVNSRAFKDGWDRVFGDKKELN